MIVRAANLQQTKLFFFLTFWTLNKDNLNGTYMNSISAERSASFIPPPLWTILVNSLISPVSGSNSPPLSRLAAIILATLEAGLEVRSSSRVCGLRLSKWTDLTAAGGPAPAPAVCVDCCTFFLRLDGRERGFSGLRKFLLLLFPPASAAAEGLLADSRFVLEDAAVNSCCCCWSLSVLTVLSFSQLLLSFRIGFFGLRELVCWSLLLLPTAPLAAVVAGSLCSDMRGVLWDSPGGGARVRKTLLLPPPSLSPGEGGRINCTNVAAEGGEELRRLPPFSPLEGLPSFTDGEGLEFSAGFETVLVGDEVATSGEMGGFGRKGETSSIMIGWKTNNRTSLD